MRRALSPDPLDVEAAGGDVGGDEDGLLIGLEAVNGLQGDAQGGGGLYCCMGKAVRGILPGYCWPLLRQGSSLKGEDSETEPGWRHNVDHSSLISMSPASSLSTP